MRNDGFADLKNGMDPNNLREKLTVIKPYTFYGNDPPRRLSKEPSKILQPLLEWAEKTHYKKGGLAGHKYSMDITVPPPRKPKNAYKFFFEQTLCEVLAKGEKFRRDEIHAVTPTIKSMWMKASPQTLNHYNSLAQQDLARYEEEMRAYEHQYPEFARELKIREHQKKARLRRHRELKKSEKEGVLHPTGAGGEPRLKKPSADAAKKVSKWLDNLNDEDLKMSEPSQQANHGEDSPSMDCDTETEDSSSFEESEDGDVGYSGAYRFP